MSEDKNDLNKDRDFAAIAAARNESFMISPLMRAACDEDPKALIKMLAFDDIASSLFLRDWKGRTALDWARLCRNYHAVSLLMKAMDTNINNARIDHISSAIDINFYLRATNQEQSKQLLHALRTRDMHKAERILNDNRLYRDEVEGLGDVFFTDIAGHSGYTPLILAAGFNFIRVVDLLIELETPVDQVNKFGHTPFTYACAAGNAEMARLLLYHGAVPQHQTNEGKTGLHFACMYAKAKTVKAILYFLFEEFVTFRIERHAKVDFDPSRWEDYAAILSKLLNIRDKHGFRAVDCIPNEANNAYATERRLRLARIKFLEPLDRRPHDLRSVNAEIDVPKYDHLDQFGHSTVTEEEKKGTNNYLTGKGRGGEDTEDSTAADEAALAATIASVLNIPPGREIESRERVRRELGSPEMRRFLSNSRKGSPDGRGGGGGGGGGAVTTASGALTITASPSDFFKQFVEATAVEEEDGETAASGGDANRGDRQLLMHYDGDNDDDNHWTGDGWGAGDDEAEEDEFGLLALSDGDVNSAEGGGSSVDDREEDEDGGRSIGEYSHDTDNLHAEGLHNLQDDHSIKTAMPLQDETELISSLLMHARMKIEEWIASAETERRLMRTSLCPLSCGAQCTVEELTAHVRDDCPFRSMQCPQCKTLIRYIDLNKHIKRHCDKRIIACPNSYAGCRDLVTADAVDSHLQLKCELRTVLCRQFCETLVTYKARQVHEDLHCKNRILVCDQCKKQMVARTYTDHLHKECPQRQVKCSVGCGQFFKARDIASHEENDCARPCKWNCGNIIGPLVSRALHENTECLKRPSTCKFGCGTPHLTLLTVEDHERDQCPTKKYDCPNGCGLLVSSDEMIRHLDSWRGSCPERLVRCPSNMVGWRIAIQPENRQGLVLKYNRTSSLQGSSNRSDFRGVDQLYVRFDDEQCWLDYWETNFILVEHVLGKVKNSSIEKVGAVAVPGEPPESKYTKFERKFECGWIMCSAMNDHLNYSCQHRPIFVTSAADRGELIEGEEEKLSMNSSLVPLIEGQAYHNIATAAVGTFRGQRSNFNNVMHVAEARHNFDNYLRSTIKSEKVFCDFCSNEVVASEMDFHLKSECGETVIRCSYGCGNKMARKFMTGHTENSCSKRPVVCPNCGDKDLWAEEMDDHFANKCPERLVICTQCSTYEPGEEPRSDNQLVLCGEWDMNTNNNGVVALLSPSRPTTPFTPTSKRKPPLALSAGVNANTSDKGAGAVAAHLGIATNAIPESKFVSAIEKVQQITVRACKLQHHLANECSMRPIQCSCGLTFPAKEIPNHQRLDCFDRVKYCPQGCGEQMKEEFLASHMEFRCANKNFKYQRMTDCPSGCGLKMMLRDVIEHVTYKCARRLVECSLKCGNTMQLDMLPKHLATCPKRVLSCEPGMKSCENQLYKWLRSDLKVERDADGRAIAGARIAAAQAANDKNINVNNTAQALAIADNGSEVAESSTFDYEDDGVVSLLGAGGAGSVVSGQSPDKYPSHVRDFLGTDSVASAASSCYFEGIKMKFSHDLRMACCPHHNVSIMMLTVRYDDLELAEFVTKQVRECDDIDLESKFGDNALTLACRLGKKDFAELLVYHGADINRETHAGKTALIEATKADKENFPLLEFLIKSGALVDYKTAKHGKTALDWARLLKRPMSVRILELASIVQRQCTFLINAITVGDLDVVKGIVAAGDFFDPCCDAKYYVAMIEHAQFEDDTNEKLERIRKKLNGVTDIVETAMYKQQDCAARLKQAENDLDQAFVDEKEASRVIAKEFGDYERVALRLLKVDIEEGLPIKNPDLSLRIAVFAFGIIFEVLNLKDYPDPNLESSTALVAVSKTEDTENAEDGDAEKLATGGGGDEDEDEEDRDAGCDDEDPGPSMYYAETYPGSGKLTHKPPVWWGEVSKSMKRSQEALRKIQTFTVTKLKAAKAAPIIERCKHLFVELVEAIHKTKHPRFDKHRVPTPAGTRSPSRHARSRASDREMQRMLHFLTGGAPKVAPEEKGNLGSENGEEYGDFGEDEEDEFDGPAAVLENTLFNKKSAKQLQLSRQATGMTDTSTDNDVVAVGVAGGEIERGYFNYTDEEEEDYDDDNDEEAHTENEGSNDDDDSNLYDDGSIPEEDWDSDHEDAWTGYWEKGEWVPIYKKRENWWDRSKKAKKQHETKLQELDKEAWKRANKKKLEMSQKFVVLSDDAIQREVGPTVGAAGSKARPKTQASHLEIDALTINNNNNNNSSSAATVDRNTSKGKQRGSTSTADVDEGRRIKSSNSLARGSRGTASSMSSTQKLKNTQDLNSTFAGSSSSSMGSRGLGVAGGRGGGVITEWGDEGDQEGDGDILALKNDGGYVSALDGVSPDDIDGYAFVEVILCLLKTIVKYSLDCEKMNAARREVARLSILKEDLLAENRQLLADHAKEFEKRELIENDLLKNIKKARYHKRMVFLNREKVRVARLLNTVASNGHTAISWAASLGNFEVVEELLSHGSSTGMVTPLIHMAATYLQMSYKIYKLGLKTRSNKRQDTVMHSSEFREEEGFEIGDTLTKVRELVIEKDKRTKHLTEYQFQRSRQRFPVPEAVYTGKWEVVERIFERRLLHYNFINTWAFPRPPPPYIPLKKGMEYQHTKMNIYEVLASGINDMASGAYVEYIGWVPPGDSREPYGETVRYVNEMMAKQQEKIDAFLGTRLRIRLLHREKINQREGAILMLEYIKAGDYKKCIQLAKDKGISIDLETDEGYTVLTGAAEENVDASNHTWMYNDDGRKCLMVEYLLDRRYYRPGIDVETKGGHTALMRAASLSRGPVVEALLDRGASIDYQNRFGKTALHYATETGNAICVRILIERFANQNLKDNDGHTCYEIAERENFVNIMSLLSQFGGGYLGPVQESRGRVTDFIRCPLGCGNSMIPRDVPTHLPECSNRMVECPKECGVTRLMFKEIDGHLEFECQHRIVYCKDCDEAMELRYMNTHLEKYCEHRYVECPLGCGKTKKFLEIPRHKKNCTYRLIPCELNCGSMLTVVSSKDHLKNDCENRRVACPLKCRGMIVFKHLEEHLAEVCQQRIRCCRFCEAEMPSVDIFTHEAICDLRLVPCTQKCGENVPFSGMEEHIKTACVHRFVNCPHSKCGIKVRVANLDSHVQDTCPERLVPCELGCLVDETVAESERVVNSFIAKLMPVHVKHECPLRLVKCVACQQSVQARDELNHMKHTCSKRIVPCGNVGCLKTLPFNQKEEHERFSCRFRLVTCAQGCGEQVTFLKLAAHMQQHCTVRVILCPLKCGQSVRSCEAEEHMKHVCLRRFAALDGEAAAADATRKTTQSKKKLPRGSTFTAGSSGATLLPVSATGTMDSNNNNSSNTIPGLTRGATSALPSSFSMRGIGEDFVMSKEGDVDSAAAAAVVSPRATCSNSMTGKKKKKLMSQSTNSLAMSNK